VLIEKLHSGAIRIYASIGGVLVTRTYYGYTRREAVKRFNAKREGNIMFTDHFKAEDWDEFKRLFPGAVNWQITRNNRREYEALCRREPANDFERNRKAELAHLYGAGE